MNQRRHLTVIAAVATLMSALPLEALFQEWTWIFQCAVIIAIICAASIGGRALRAPVWAQPLIGMVALVIGLTWVHAGTGHAFGGLIPDEDTFRYFGHLIDGAGNDITQMSIPVTDTPNLLFLTSAGVGACAVLVDLLAVGLRKPALAGLPMLAIYTVPIQINRTGISFVPFAIGACGFLWLLISDSIDRVRLFGRRFTGDGRGVDAWETSPLSSIGRRIAVIGVVLAIAVPVILPSIGDGLFGIGGGAGNGDGTGACHGTCPHSNEVDLFADLRGHLSNGKPTDEIQVTTTDKSPYYMRYAVAGNLEKDGFHETVPDGSTPQGTPPASVGSSYTPYRATVKVQAFSNTFLPDYYDTLYASLAGVSSAWHYNDDTMAIYSSNTAARGANYTFDFQRLNIPDPTVLRGVPRLPGSDPINVKYASVPQQIPAVVDWVSKYSGSATNEYDTVIDLYDSLGTKHGFSYQLETSSGTTGSDIGDFLQQKKGFCVQYAATLAWLVRERGYPARVAFGFTRGVLAGPDTYQMTDHDLHAWTEVYFSGYGWLPFDATPGGNIPGSVQTTWAPGPDTVANPGVSTAPRPSGSAASGGAGVTGPRPDRSTPGGEVLGGGSGHGFPTWGWALLAALLVVVLAVASPLVSRRLARRRRSAIDHRFAGPAIGELAVVVDDATDIESRRRRAHTAWDEFMDTLVDFDVAIDAAETPRATAARIVATTELTSDAARGVETIGASEQQARYARVPDPADDLDGELRRFRRELAMNVPFSTRLRAELFPPSVTNRWRATAANRAAVISSAVQATRERVVGALNLRWLSPRRLLAGRAR